MSKQSHTMPERPSTAESSFVDRVYMLVRKIPRGRVTTYGAIAEACGSRISAKMVGWAMNMSHRVLPPVPAHRVVNRKGILTGKHHFATPTLMQELLEREGIRVEDDRVIDFDKLFWDPRKSI
ncbi:MAG: MGMT family protein [Thermoflavifilum sp.]|nr:MGMT family protein [Thermoflavifilum sp.]